MLRRAKSLMLLFVSITTLGICFIVLPIIALFLLLDPNILAKIYLKDPIFYVQARKAFLITLEASSISTILLIMLGVPIAYLLARSNFIGKSIVEGIIDIPLMLPHTVAGIMILCAYSGRGLLGDLLKTLNITIEDNFWGIVITMMFVSFPLMVDTIKIGFESINPTLELVARSLGASAFKAFTTISLPLASQSILAGVILAWARALSEVGAILVVAYFPKTINVLTLEWLNTYGLKYAIALSIPLVLLALLLFIVFRLMVSKE